MLLYLIRHAHALDGSDDAARPLSKRGREQIRVLARFLRGGGELCPEEIWHSPLVRACQTAELLARRLRVEVPLVRVDGLLPGDDPRRIARRLKSLSRTVALVGHEPHLSALASLLITGAAAPPVFVLKKSAIIALERVAARWVVRWHLSPELLA